MTYEDFIHSPTDYGSPARIQELLGFTKSEILEKLICIDELAPFLNNKIIEKIDGKEPIRLDNENPIHQASVLPLRELYSLARVTTVLINHRAVLNTTSGVDLAGAIEVCGTEKVIDMIMETDLPDLVSIPVLDTVSRERVTEYSHFCYTLILGLFSAGIRGRMLLRHPIEADVEFFDFSDHREDEATISLLLSSAMKLLPNVVEIEEGESNESDAFAASGMEDSNDAQDSSS